MPRFDTCSPQHFSPVVNFMASSSFGWRAGRFSLTHSLHRSRCPVTYSSVPSNPNGACLEALAHGAKGRQNSSLALFARWTLVKRRTTIDFPKFLRCRRVQQQKRGGRRSRKLPGHSCTSSPDKSMESSGHGKPLIFCCPRHARAFPAWTICLSFKTHRQSAVSTYILDDLSGAQGFSISASARPMPRVAKATRAWAYRDTAMACGDMAPTPGTVAILPLNPPPLVSRRPPLEWSSLANAHHLPSPHPPREGHPPFHTPSGSHSDQD